MVTLQPLLTFLSYHFNTFLHLNTKLPFLVKAQTHKHSLMCSKKILIYLRVGNRGKNMRIPYISMVQQKRFVCLMLFNIHRSKIKIIAPDFYIPRPSPIFLLFSCHITFFHLSFSSVLRYYFHLLDVEVMLFELTSNTYSRAL